MFLSEDLRVSGEAGSSTGPGQRQVEREAGLEFVVADHGQKQ